MSGPEIELARATRADIPFVMATERISGYEQFVGRWDLDQHEAAIADSSNAYFIGRHGGKPFGFVIVQNWASADGATLIKRIIVADTGRNLGRALLSQVVDTIFKQTQASRIWLNVYPDNIRAQKAYRALGFDFEQRDVNPTSSDASRRPMLMMVLSRPTR